MKPQLTLNNSGVLRVAMNSKTGKFFRARLNKDTDRRTDYSWTDQIRLAESWHLGTEEQIIEDLEKSYGVMQSEFEFKYFQLQYVEIIKTIQAMKKVVLPGIIYYEVELKGVSYMSFNPQELVVRMAQANLSLNQLLV